MNRKWFRMICSALTIILIAEIIILMQGKDVKASGYDEEYYSELEEEYLCEVHESLECLGLGKTGVNLTRITSEDEGRQYKLVLCSERFNEKSLSDEVESLISDIAFGDGRCEIAVHTKAD